jgi:anti-sigma factor RsiW
MTGGRRFSLSSPDWGQDHLSLDAIVAYVDDELAAGARDRAEAHLAYCRDCQAEVVAQVQARSVLRAAAAPMLPSSLLRTLRSIPVEAELPPPPPGLGITADGQFVLLRDVPRTAGPEGSGVPELRPAGLGPEPVPGPRRFSRRARIGGVSGLALGALAVGALAAPGPATPEQQGVVPTGPVLNVPVEARLSAGPDVPAVGRSGPGLLTPAVADSGDSATMQETPAPVDDAGVLDGRLRELDRRPVAFYYRAP